VFCIVLRIVDKNPVSVLVSSTLLFLFISAIVLLLSSFVIPGGGGGEGREVSYCLLSCGAGAGAGGAGGSGGAGGAGAVGASSTLLLGNAVPLFFSHNPVLLFFRVPLGHLVLFFLVPIF
jgi:hypothetical protein